MASIPPATLLTRLVEKGCPERAGKRPTGALEGSTGANQRGAGAHKYLQYCRQAQSVFFFDFSAVGGLPFKQENPVC